MGFDWRQIYILSAVILGVLCVLCFFFLKESPEEIGEQEPPDNSTNLVETHSDNKEISLSDIFKILLTNRTFLVICGLSLGCTLVRETFNTWTTLYFAELGFDEVAAAAHSAWFPLFGGISVLLAGFASDRLGTQGRASIIVWGLLLTSIFLVFLGSLNFGTSNYLQVALIALIAFVLIGPYSYLGGAMALDLGGKKGSALACGLIDGVGYLGGFLAGGSIAKISVVFGWSGAFFSLAGIAFISFLSALYYMFEQRKVVSVVSPEASS